MFLVPKPNQTLRTALSQDQIERFKHKETFTFNISNNISLFCRNIQANIYSFDCVEIKEQLLQQRKTVFQGFVATVGLLAGVDTKCISSCNIQHGVGTARTADFSHRMSPSVESRLLWMSWTPSSFSLQQLDNCDANQLNDPVIVLNFH